MELHKVSRLINDSTRTNINADENDKAHKDVRFKNNAPFTSCILRIYNTFINNAEDIVMPMGNLLEYSDNYSMDTGSLWNFYRDKTDDVDNDALNDKSLKYKTEIIEKTPA